MKDTDAALRDWQELNRAIDSNDLPVVKRIIARRPEFLAIMPDLGSCLILAARLDRLAIVAFLIEKGADVDQVESCIDSPLCAASAKGNVQVVKYLLDRKAKLDVSSPDLNPLFSAIYGSSPDVARLLMDAGIDCQAVYRTTSGSLKNALSYAQERGQGEIVALLHKAGCRLPVEVVDSPIWEPEDLRKKASPKKARPKSGRKQIIALLAAIYGKVDREALIEIVPVHDELRIDVHVIRPQEDHPYLTIFTTGMSDRPMTVPKGQDAYQYAELIMHLPGTWKLPRRLTKDDQWLWPFQWLRQVAYFPHLNDTWLGGMSTIVSSDEPPVPLGPNTEMTCLLLLADFNRWSPMQLDDGKKVHFYTVVPIYTEERDFEKKHGVVALVQRLQNQGHTTVVSVNRANVASE